MLYGAPIIFNESDYCITQLESILMGFYKWIYNKNTYVVKYRKISKDIKVEEPSQKLLKANTRFICKAMLENKVDQLLNCMVIHPRTETKSYMVDPEKKNYSAVIIRHNHLYNALPYDLKVLNPERLKRKLSKLHVTFKG